MLDIITYFIFIFSVAFAAAGILTANRLRSSIGSGPFSAMLYYQAFIFTFGFYGIWGQVIIKTFLSGLVSDELLKKFLDISVLPGLPFLIFAWLMLIKFSREITGRDKSRYFITIFLAANFIALLALGLIITSNQGTGHQVYLRYYFIIFTLLYYGAAAAHLFFRKKKNTLLHKYEGRIAAFSLILISSSQCLILGYYNDRPLPGLLFVFTFFAGSSFLPLYFKYGTTLSSLKLDSETDLSYDDFCKKFEISPREGEIIREICNGLSNKEISEKLFISLQTVKDHTHRIYIKTNVKSRVQLITLLREIRIKP